MTILIKNANISYTPGVPGFPGKPAVPATLPRTVVSTAETPGSWVTQITGGSGGTNAATQEYWWLTTGQLVWVPAHTTTSITVIPGSPGQPAVPPIAATPSTKISDLNIGWNASAKSTRRVNTGQFAGFQFAPSSVGVVAGLYEDPYDVAKIDSYKNMPYAFYISRGKAQVMMHGAGVGPLIDFVAEDEFAIQYDRSTISFMKNNELLKSVAISPVNDSLTFSVFSVMYTAEDTVLNAHISDAVVNPVSVNTAIKLIAFGRQGTETGNTLYFPALTTSVSAPQNVAVVSLRPLNSRNSDHPYAESTARLEPLTTTILDGEIGLGVAAASLVMYPLMTGATGTTGTLGHSDTACEKLQSMNSDRPIGEVKISLLPIRAVGISYTGLTYATLTSGAGTLRATGRQEARPIPSGGSMNIPAPTLRFFSGASLKKPLPSVVLTAHGVIGAMGNADITMPSPLLSASGTIVDMARASMYLSGYSLTASGISGGSGKASLTAGVSFAGWSGAFAKIASPAYQLQATGSVSSVGRAAMSAPAPTLVASGKISSVGKASIVLSGKVTMNARTGWRSAALTFSGGYSMESSGIQDSSAHARLTSPKLSLLAYAITETLAHADLLLPMIYSSAPTTVKLTLPTYQLRFTASGDIALEYEAYSLTLSHAIDTPAQSIEMTTEAMTRYTRYPFTQIVRFGSSYYGASTDGLYLLEGDTDDGAPIAWDFELTQNDFRQPNLKRIVSSVIGGRIPPLSNFTLKIGERADETYSYNNAHDTTVQNYRQRFGRGVRARYLSVGMNCAQGSDFEIDSISMEVETLSRKTHG